MLVHEQAAGDIGELIAGRAVDFPYGRKALAAREDLLHEDDETATRLLESGGEALRVACRVAQPVDVVDTHPCEAFVGTELEDETVCEEEDARILYTDPDQPVDVEEPAIVDLVPAQPPVAGAVVLAADEGLHVAAGLAVGRERENLSIHLEQRTLVVHNDSGVSAGPLQRPAQCGYQDPAGLGGPIDVEDGGSFRLLAVSHDLPPPPVRRVCRHVVWDDVDQ